MRRLVHGGGASARPADPPDASTSTGKGVRGLCRVCRVLIESDLKVAPSEHLLAPPGSVRFSKRSVSEGRSGVEGGPRLGGPSRFDAGAGIEEDPGAFRAPSRRAPGGPHAPRAGTGSRNQTTR